jgi:hypothetical protein
MFWFDLLCKLQTYVDKNPRTRCRPITALFLHGRIKLRTGLQAVLLSAYLTVYQMGPSPRMEQQRVLAHQVEADLNGSQGAVRQAVRHLMEAPRPVFNVEDKV